MSGKLLNFLTVLWGLALFSLLGFGVFYSKLDSDPALYFGENNTDYQRTRLIEETFTPNDIIVFIIEAREGTVFKNKTLLVIEELTRELWKQTHVQRVDSLSNFNKIIVNDDDIETVPFVNNVLNLTAAELTEMKRYAISHPRIFKRLVSEKKDLAVVYATLNVKRGTPELLNTAKWAHQLEAEFAQKNPDLNFYLAGNAIFAETFTDVTREEFKLRVPMILLAIIIFLFAVLRDLVLVTSVVVVILITIVSTLGLGGWLGMPVTPVMAFVPVTLITIVLADAVHFLSGFQHFHQMESRKRALVSSRDLHIKPMLLTSLTTAIGFLMLNSSDSPPYRDLGTLIAAGCVLAFLYSVYWLPALISFVGVSKQKIEVQENSLSFIFNAILKVKVPLLWVGIPVMLLMFIPVSQLEFNETMVDNIDDSLLLKRTANMLDTRLTGIHRIDLVVIESGENGEGFPVADGITTQSVLTPETIAIMAEFRKWAMAQKQVADVIAIDQIVVELNQLLHGNDPEHAVVPKSAELLSQIVLLYEMSLPYGMGLEYLLDFDKSSTRIRVMLHSSSSEELIAFEENAIEWFASKKAKNLSIESGGLDINFSRLNRINAISMVNGALAAFFMIALLLCFALGSFKYGMLSLLPNLLPVLLTYGLWSMVGGKISLATSIVACITLGIVVDDTIHLLVRYVEELKKGNSPESSARVAVRTSGRALVITTVILCISFGLLATSGFRPNAELGILTAGTLGIALAINFLIFLPLLVMIDSRSKRITGGLGESQDPQ